MNKLGFIQARPADLCCVFIDIRLEWHLDPEIQSAESLSRCIFYSRIEQALCRLHAGFDFA
ncbi:MAG: hypothetical protein K2X63_06355 [Burkholderiaceae bacterium]|nr:hypothetical protein [Burkholderiaceae bacterium]